MKHLLETNLLILGLIGTLMILQGCTPGHNENDGHDHAAETSGGGHGHDVKILSKYKEVVVEFPGHKYAMEIIDEKETTGLVTAFVTDADFEPTEVDAREVRLNFMVDGKPKTLILTRIPQETGKPAIFTLTDMELATLICEGWRGEATATIEIGGIPYNSKLVKLSQHDDNGKHDHAH